MGAPRTAFDTDLGTHQGRIQPTNWTPADGAYAYVLGHDLPGIMRYVAAGDFHSVAQPGFDFTGVTFYRQVIHIRAPKTMPAGVSWVFECGDFFPITIDPSWPEFTFYDQTILVVSGSSSLLYTLTLDGPSGTYEVELPGVYVDRVAVDTTTAPGPVLCNRIPEPGMIQVPATVPITFSLLDPSVDTFSTASVYVQGELVMTVVGDTSPILFLAPGWSQAGGVGIGFMVYVLTPPAPWGSSELVTVRVTATMGDAFAFTHGGFPDNQIVVLSHPFTGGEAVTLVTEGTLPPPLVTGRTYYIEVQDFDDVTLLDAPGGPEINITGAGDGVLLFARPGAPPFDSSYSWTSADVVAPAVVEAIAPDELTVDVTFDEAVQAVDPSGDHDALNPAAYTLSLVDGLPAVTPLVVSVALVSATTVALTLDRIMTRGATYQLATTGPADVFGNVITTPSLVTFVGYQWPVPDGRTTGLFAMLPEAIRAGDVSGDHANLLDTLQELFDIYYGIADRMPQYIDPDFAPEAWVDLMLSDLGNPFDFLDLSEDEKRLLVQTLLAIYRTKGTGPGIVSAIRFFLGITVQLSVYAWAPYPIGVAVIGSTLILGSNEPSDLYTFVVTVAQFLTATERKNISAIVEYMKVAHEHFVLIEPVVPVVIDHWTIGFSLLGSQSLLHGP